MQAAATAGPLLVQAQMTPDPSIARRGQPEARLQALLDQLAPRHTQGSILQGLRALQEELRLQLVGLEGRPSAQRCQRLRAQAPVQMQAGAAQTRLADEAVVIGKARADLLQMHAVVPVLVAAAPGQPELVPRIGRRALQAALLVEPRRGAGGQQMAAQQIGVAGGPAEVAADDAVVAAGAVVARGRQQAQAQRCQQLYAAPRETSQRAGRLDKAGRAVGAGTQDQAATGIAQMQGRGLGRGSAPGRPQAPVGVGDGARVEGGQAAVLARVIGLALADGVAALQEEGPLLRHAEGEAGVAGQLRRIELDLGEIGVQGGVDHPVSARPPLQFGANRGPFAAAPGQLGPQVQEAALAHLFDQVAQALDGLQLGDEAQRVLGQRHADQQGALLARNAAGHHQAPGRALAVGKAQRRQGPAQLDAVAIGQALHGGLQIEVGREVLHIVVGGEQAVGQHAGRADAYKLGRAALTHRVDHDRDEVLIAPHLVAPRQRRPDQLGRWIVGSDAEDQRILGGQQLHRGAPARRLLVLGQELHETVVQGRTLPDGLVEAPVNGRWCVGAGQAQSLRAGGERGQAQQRQREGEKFHR
eukprot:Opistho-2@49181